MVKVESIVYKNLNKDNILGDLKKNEPFSIYHDEFCKLMCN